eukprot:COSAG02_NODE_35_length_49339_cov_20.375102_39_plen_169_part_00
MCMHAAQPRGSDLLRLSCSEASPPQQEVWHHVCRGSEPYALKIYTICLDGWMAGWLPSYLAVWLAGCRVTPCHGHGYSLQQEVDRPEEDERRLLHHRHRPRDARLTAVRQHRRRGRARFRRHLQPPHSTHGDWRRRVPHSPCSCFKRSDFSDSPKNFSDRFSRFHRPQ